MTDTPTLSDPDAGEEVTAELVGWISELYSFSIVGGPLHIVVDDVNVEDHHLLYCLRTLHEHWAVVGTKRTLFEPGMGGPPAEERRRIRELTFLIVGALLTLGPAQREAVIESPEIGR